MLSVIVMAKLNKIKVEKVIMGVDPGTNMMGYGILNVCGNKAEMVVMGVIELKKYKDMYMRLGKIFERITEIIDSYHPDEIAIEAPFFGKNVQSMLKLGRAQGVAIAAAIQRDVPITEYMPTKIKMAITGNGGASKDQVAGMLQRMLNISEESMRIQFDASSHVNETDKRTVPFPPIKIPPKGVSFSDFICTFAMSCCDFHLISNRDTKLSEKSDIVKS